MITIFYDLDCGFCVWATVRLARRVRGPVTARTIQEARSDILANVDNVLGSFHVWADGQLYSAGAGLAELLSATRYRPLGLLLRRYGRLSDRVYYLLARRRAACARLLPERSKRHAREQIDNYRTGSI